LSSKSFRGKKRYLILLARHNDQGLDKHGGGMIVNDKYVSNSSFEEEFEGAGLTSTGLTALVMQTLKIRRNSSGHREMFAKLVIF